MVTDKLKSFLQKEIEYYDAISNKEITEFTNIYDYYYDTSKAKSIVNVCNEYLISLNSIDDESEFVFKTKIRIGQKTNLLIEKRKEIQSEESNVEIEIWYKEMGKINGYIHAETMIAVIVDEMDLELAKKII